MIMTMLASCKTTEGPEETQTLSTSEVSNDPLVAEIDEYIAALSEEHQFNGKTFTWVGSGAENPTDEEEIGDVQSDARYYRQRDIEEKFDVDWVNYVPERLEGVGESPTVTAVKEDVMAGSGLISAGHGMQNPVIHPLLGNNMLLDLNEFDDIDYEREWWPASLRESYTIAGSLFMLNGPIVSYYYQDAASVIFNKSLAENYGVADPYEIVKAGEWTFDKMFELASAVPENQAGSGAYRYGNAEAIRLILACGYTVTKFDENGIPYVESTLTKEMSDLADKFSAVFGDDSQSANEKDYTVSESWDEKYGYDNYSEMFADNKVLFMFIPTDEAAWLRIKEVTFGILPMPKLNEQQENYISYADRSSIQDVFVPKSAQNRDMIDIVLESMAALGYKYFKPVYYDNILKSRATYDSESQDMVDIIFNGKKYDIITILDDSDSYVGLLNRAFVESSEGISSKFQMQGKVVNNKIKQIVANIEK